MPEHFKVGLRFDRSQAASLRDHGHRLAAHGQDAGIFDSAADSAEVDEPLVLLCEDRNEAEQVASAFVLHGFDRPAIDELNG